MRLKQLFLYSSISLLFLISCTSNKAPEIADWCDQEIRPEFSELKEIKTSSSWFKVYEVGENVYAIAEPFNFQEVISYLIIGNEKALLFDTGMGLASIAAITKELTKLPVTVINSHTHYDHIGGNHEFENILARNTAFTNSRSKNGLKHKQVKHEVTKEALCLKMLPALDTSNYYIKPFPIVEYVENGTVITLGNRNIEVIAVPGHTPDAIALLEEESGYLWTGDTFYEAPIWLFDEGTNLEEYQKSIETLAAVSPKLKKVFPAHNTAVVKPVRLVEAIDAFKQIMNGSKKEKSVEKSGQTNTSPAVFEFDHFSFIIRRDLLKAN